MKILPLTLTGPMQSYGYLSRYAKNRDAGTGFPTLSAVVGMLANICDIPRDKPDQLHTQGFTSLDIIVRVDQPGKRERDFQTIVFTKPGVKKDNKIVIKEYLTDAKFLVGVFAKDEAGLNALELIEKNRTNPKNQLYLGRRSYTPDSITIHPVQNYKTAEEFLTIFPPLSEANNIKNLTVVKTTTPGEKSTMVIDDIPISFEQGNRRYASRSISIDFIDISNTVDVATDKTAGIARKSKYAFSPIDIIDNMFDSQYNNSAGKNK